MVHPHTRVAWLHLGSLLPIFALTHEMRVLETVEDILVVAFLATFELLEGDAAGAARPTNDKEPATYFQNRLDKGTFFELTRESASWPDQILSR